MDYYVRNFGLIHVGLGSCPVDSRQIAFCVPLRDSFVELGQWLRGVDLIGLVCKEQMGTLPHPNLVSLISLETVKLLFL